MEWSVVGVDGQITQIQDFHPGEWCLCPVWNQAAESQEEERIVH